MGKILQSDIAGWVDTYRTIEQRDTMLRKKDAVYEPSTALETIEQLAAKWSYDPDIHLGRALKHCTEGHRGVKFVQSFRELHAMIYLIRDRRLTYEMARKQARRVLETAKTDPENPFFKTVRKGHHFLFRQ